MRQKWIPPCSEAAAGMTGKWEITTTEEQLNFAP